ncbi:MAG: DUF393 domain-containing protein [Flavobacteriales bacterium]|nr:DUF393 domain-containing protein [Flavobacteriales bacterium]
MESDRHIVFFDGVCGLCNRSVTFLLKRSKNRANLLFSPLQGESAQHYLTDEERNLDTIVYFRQGHSYSRSTAILMILWDIGGIWKLSGVIFIIPRFLRDACYNWIARHRYQWFGKHENCRIPTSSERARFLD